MNIVAYYQELDEHERLDRSELHDAAIADEQAANKKRMADAIEAAKTAETPAAQQFAAVAFLLAVIDGGRRHA